MAARTEIGVGECGGRSPPWKNEEAVPLLPQSVFSLCHKLICHHVKSGRARCKTCEPSHSVLGCAARHSSISERKAVG